MNKVMLLGRITRDVEIRYSQRHQSLTIGRYTLAVSRRYKQQGQPEVDFIECVVFGKLAEFAQRYFQKGQQIAVAGRLQVSTYEVEEGSKKQKVNVIIEEQYFAEGKRDTSQNKNIAYEQGFYPIDISEEDENLPF